jgi:hypothetical protein
MDSFSALEVPYKGLAAYGHAHRPLGRIFFFACLCFAKGRRQA